MANRVEESRPVEWRIIDGKAADVPMGGHIAYRFKDGEISKIILRRRAPDGETPPGHLCFEAVHNASMTWDLLPADLSRYVRLEFVPAGEAVPS